MEIKVYQDLLDFNWNLLFSAITVLVLYLILKHFFFEKVHTFMMARQAKIEEELADADLQNKKAYELLDEYSQTLKNAEEEKRQIIKEAKATADARAEEIISNAQQEAQDIMKDARKKMEEEEQKTITGLKKEIAAIAILTAQQIMEKELTDGDQQELVDKVIEEAASGKWQNQ